MGLRALNLENWLERDDNYGDEIALKRKLYAEQAEQVFAVLPEGLVGSTETLELISNQLSHCDVSNQVFEPELHPLHSASLLVQEDLCVMSKLAGQWKLTAASVCFPSRWDLTEKIGTSLAQIHAPVPHYAQRIGPATDAMFDKFEVERPVWRLNWTILDNPELFQPRVISGELDPESSLAQFAQNLYLRIERQTLRVLPVSKDVLFTIRTYVDSLAAIAQRYPEFQANIAQTLQAVSPETRTYKGWDRLWDKLQDWSAATQ